MNCRSVTKMLPAYFVENLEAEQAQAVQQHLQTCLDCQSALAHLSALDTHLKDTLGRHMQHLDPPSNAWSGIQAKISAGTQHAPANLRLVRIALVIAVLFLAALPVAPSVFARLEEIAQNWLQIRVPSSDTTVTLDNFEAFTPWAPSTLPAGFDLTTSGVHLNPDSQELQLIYARGTDQFLLVETNAAGHDDLSQGLPVVLGTQHGTLFDPAGVIDESYSAVFPHGEVRLLAWEQKDIRIRLYSNMPVEDILQFARSMRPVQR